MRGQVFGAYLEERLAVCLKKSRGACLSHNAVVFVQMAPDGVEDALLVC
jgi:hypothetical protein